MAKRGEFARHFPLLGVEHDCLISKGGDLTVGFRVDLPEIFKLAASDYDALHELWVRALRMLPPWTVVHKQDWFVQHRQGLGALEDQTFLGRSSARHFHGRPFYAHSCFLFVTLTNRSRMRRGSLGSSLCKPPAVGDDRRRVESLDVFLQAVDQLSHLLQSTGSIALSRLRRADWMGDSSGPGVVEHYLTLGDPGPLCLEDFTFRPGDTRVGNKQLEVFTMSDTDDLPFEVGTSLRSGKYSTDHSSTHLSFASPLGILLDCDHVYNQYVFLHDAKELHRELESRQRQMVSMGLMSRSNDDNAELIEEYLHLGRERQLLSVRAHFNVMAWSDGAAGLTSARNKVVSALASLDIRPRHNTVDAARLYWAGMPGNGAEFPREESYYTFLEPAVCLFANETHYRSSLSPLGIKLSDRISGRPVHLDISDEPMDRGITTNRNKFILGPSGSGKSFFTNHMVRHYYEQGAHIVLVDVGNSYEGLCGLIHQQTGGQDGVYFTYTDEHPISFNPFYVEDGVFTDRKIESISTLILVLWKGGNEEAKKAELAEVGSAVSEFVSRLRAGTPGVTANFNGFYEFLRDEYRDSLRGRDVAVRREDFDVDNLLITLKPYYRGGRYDFLLNSAEHLDLLSKRFVVFEIDAVKDNVELFPVVAIIIMEAFINKMFRLTGVRKMILIEEAWKAIANANMAGYIQYLYKTVRKHFGEAIVVTQEIDDIISSPIVKHSIINNSDCKILLDQRKYMNRFDAIQSLLGLSDKEREQILSINTNNAPDRKYKEVWIGLGGTHSAVYATEVSGEEYYTYTTEQREKLRVQSLASRRGGDLETALRELAQGD